MKTIHRLKSVAIVGYWVIRMWVLVARGRWYVAREAPLWVLQAIASTTPEAEDGSLALELWEQVIDELALRMGKL